MSKKLTKIVGLAIALLPVCFMTAHAQSTPAKEMHYKDFVGENPSADADIKIVSDYVNNLVNGKVDMATASLASGYKGYGPGPNDSTNAEMVSSGWKHSDSTETNRKIDFAAATFNVKSGDLAGHWVALWGTYGFTEGGKTVSFPFHYSAHVKNGKIDSDHIYFDQLYILTALGYTVTPPSK